MVRRSTVCRSTKGPLLVVAVGGTPEERCPSLPESCGGGMPCRDVFFLGDDETLKLMFENITKDRNLKTSKTLRCDLEGAKWMGVGVPFCNLLGFQKNHLLEAAGMYIRYYKMYTYKWETRRKIFCNPDGSALHGFLCPQSKSSNEKPRVRICKTSTDRPEKRTPDRNSRPGENHEFFR